MITYNFYDFLENFKLIQTHFCTYLPLTPDVNVEKGIAGKAGAVDNLWNQIDKIFQKLPWDLHNQIEAMKHDVLMSVYASIFYTCTSPVQYQSVLNAFKKNDSSSQCNEDSANSERVNLTQIRTALRKAYSPILLSGQLFDNNEISYLATYWNGDSFRAFNELDFYYYLKSYTHWPYYPDNLDGMTFSKYFSGVTDMFRHITEDSRSPAQAGNFSSYIFEELFHPENFILNVSKYLPAFGGEFHDTHSPRRERAIVLFRPLFKLPRSLWFQENETYISALKAHIDNPRDITTDFRFKAHVSQLLFYQKCLYPCLQAMFSMYLYHALDSDLSAIKKILETYINEHPASFDYLALLEKQLQQLPTIYYPVIEKGKCIPLNSDNSKKRNNSAIESFDINFTYNFFDIPHTFNLFEYWKYRDNNVTIESFLAKSTQDYSSASYGFANGLSTSNYIQVKKKKLNLSF